MAVNNYSVGKDLSFQLNMPDGTLNILLDATEYSVKKKNTLLTRKSLSSGKTIHGNIPDGFEITIRLDRRDATIDRYFAAQDASYYAGVNIVGGQIQETITEKDGSKSNFLYTDVTLQYDGPGDWRSDAYIPITIMAYATERLAV